MPVARSTEPSAPPDAASPADPDGVATALARLVGREPELRWAVRLVPSADTDANELVPTASCPPNVPLSRAASTLALRARDAGRVMRVRLPDGRDEWLAVPHADGAARGGLTLLGARELGDARRDALVRTVGGASARGPVPGSVADPRSDPEKGPKPASQRSVPQQSSRQDPRPGPPPGPVPGPPSVVAGASSFADTVLAAAAGADVDAFALALADAAATATGCRRVTVGVERRGAARLLAVSGEARPDRRREAVRRLRDVLDEVFDGDRGDAWPSLDAPDSEAGTAGDAAAGEAHRRAHAADGLPLLSLLARGPDGVRVAAVLERAASHPFTPDDRDALEARLGPALALLGRFERGRGGRFGRGAERVRSALARGRSPARLGVAAALGVVLVGLVAVPLPYRVSARVVVEASERQVLGAPFAGHVRSARAKAGDVVAAGEVLATLDERELVLAGERWRGELAKNRAEQSSALARHDRVELARLRADAARLDAELALVEERRARATIRAPFDGVVIAGDPTRSLGAPVEAGEVLFEIAAGERRSPLVEIDERDIAEIEENARVRVRMSASPREVREARLDALVPVATAETGRSVFRVPATFVDGADAALSPGMRGVARIDAGRRPLASAWTRALRERLLLLAWSFGLVR